MELNRFSIEELRELREIVSSKAYSNFVSEKKRDELMELAQKIHEYIIELQKKVKNPIPLLRIGSYDNESKYRDIETAKLKNMDWIKLKYRKPTIKENGDKVLLYRKLNKTQESQSITVHSTSKVKYCNPDETWWMQLPPMPEQ